MRLVVAAMMTLALAQTAVAQTASTSTSTSTSASNSGASIVNNAPSVVRSRGTNDVTASAFAPGLTAAGINSCAGSISGGVGGTGFNFGLGGTYEMEECTARANAAALAGLGQGLAALESLCQSEKMRRALNASGTVCPSQRAEFVEAQRRADESGRPYVATELAEALPPTVPTRRQRVSRRGYERRAAVEAQASNSGASIAQSAASRR